MSSNSNDLKQLEKAFGGCRNCYGKGYSTARVGTSSRYGNVTKDTIIYCKCSRGDQLEKLLADREKTLTEKVDRIEVIDETGRAYIKGSIYGSPVKVELSLQDSNRTLKVFVEALSPTKSDGGES